MPSPCPIPIDSRTSEALEWPAVLRALATRCVTARAAADAVQTNCSVDLSTIESEHSEVAEVRELIARHGVPPLSEIADIRTVVIPVEKGGTIGLQSLAEVADSVSAIERLRTWLLRHCTAGSRVHDRAHGFCDLSELEVYLSQLFAEDGTLSDRASPDLGRLRQRLVRKRDEVIRRIRDLMDRPDIGSSLQDRFYTERDERYVLPIRSDAGQKVPGIVLGASASGATLFVEPNEITSLNNDLHFARVSVLQEEARILAEASRQVALDLSAIVHNLTAYNGFDLCCARAKLANDLDASMPQLGSAEPMALRNLRHPLLLLAGENAIPSDITLEQGSTLVISGPNAGGKTVFMKAVGLAALMVRAGIPIPAAPESRMPIFETVLAEIGDHQSISQQLSTFTAHLRTLGEIIVRADARALTLIDEIVTGTDPREGSALAQAVIEDLTARGVTTIVTTHYERLKELAAITPRVRNASVGFDLDKLAPTFRLKADAPGSSFAIAAATQLGLPKSLLERACSLMGESSLRADALMQKLEQREVELHDEKNKLEALRRDVEQQRNALAEERLRLKREGKRAMEAAHLNALSELRTARATLLSAKQQVEMRRSPKQLKISEAQVDAAAATIRSAEAVIHGKTMTGRERVDSEQLKPGARVWVIPWNAEGSILAIESKQRVRVQVGPMQLSVDISELAAPDGMKKREIPRRNVARSNVKHVAPAGLLDPDRTPMRLPHTTLDLRGTRVDDALSELDAFIDRLRYEDNDVGFVLHGYGSGALRDAVRRRIRESVPPLESRPGTEKEGGDAITVIAVS